MEGKLQLRKPENWQDFERLCKKLWGEIWGCPNTIKRNGRQGQAQKGVDICGVPKDEMGYYGIQCKGKDDYTHSQLTIEEIDTEIAKACTFEPSLCTFYFATTANKDANIEEYIRKKNIESIKTGGFNIDIFSWEDIVDLIESNRDTYNWYINNCQYKDATDVDVCINSQKEYVIEPQYIRTTTRYRQKQDIYTNLHSALFGGLNNYSAYSKAFTLPNTNFINALDHSWCVVPVEVKNTGATVIEDYKLDLIFEENKIIELDDRFGGRQIRPISVKREVYQSIGQNNKVECIPSNSTLVQTDSKTFAVGVQPEFGQNQIKVQWILRSRNYHKKGELSINVVPKIEERERILDAEESQHKQLPQINIEPKIE